MAKQVKNTDIFQKDIFKKESEDAKAFLIVLNSIEKQFKDILKFSGQAIKTDPKTAQDYKKIEENIKKVEGATKGLSEIEKQREKVKKQQQQTLAKLLTTREKSTKILIKGTEALRQSRTAIKDLIRLQRAEKGSVDQLNAVNKILTKRRNGLSEATKKGRVAIERLNRVIGKNETKIKNIQGTTNKWQGGLDRLNNSVNRVGIAMFGAFGARAIFRRIKNLFSITVDFEKAQSKLASILGTTKDEIGDLTKDSKKYGSTTAFTAKQVSGLQVSLAKLGFASRDIKKSTKGILNLAAATGTDLEESATIAGSSLRAFGLDASEMGRVTEVLGIVTTKSALDMEKLKTALATVGVTAKNAGFSIEETVSFLGQLTDRGIDASTAGTSLRNIFLELSKKGLTLNEALEQIRNSTDKNKTSMDLFGKRSATAGIILSETQDSAAGLTEELEGLNGELEEMAEEQLDNVAGSMTKLSSAWEGFILNVDDGNGIISASVKGFIDLTTAIIGLSNTMDEWDATAKRFERGSFIDKFTGEAQKVVLMNVIMEKLGDRLVDNTILFEASLKTLALEFKKSGAVLTKEDEELFKKMVLNRKMLLEMEERGTKITEAILDEEELKKFSSRVQKFKDIKEDIEEDLISEPIDLRPITELTEKDLENFKTSSKESLQTYRDFLQTKSDLEIASREQEMNLEIAQLKLSESYAVSATEDREKAIQAIKDRYRDEDLAKTKEALKEATDAAGELLTERTAKRIKAIDDEISAEQKRITTLEKLANMGNEEAAKSLAVEQKRIAELQIKKERELKKQQTQQLIIAGIQTYSNKVAANKGNALASTITDITLLKAFISSLGSFFEGTDDIGKGGNLDKKGGRLIVAHDNEQIWSKKDRGDVGFRSRDDIKDIVSMHDSVKYQQIEPKTIDRTINDKLLRDINKNLLSLPSKMPKHEVYLDQLNNIITLVTKEQRGVFRTHKKFSQ